MSLFFDSPKPRPQHARKLLRCLSRELWRIPAARSLQVVDEILEATVPILRVRTRDSRRLEADISLGSQLENSCDEATLHPSAGCCSVFSTCSLSASSLASVVATVQHL